MTPAYLVTLSRIPGALIAAWCLLQAPPLLIAALVAVIYCEISDALDGMVARATKQTSALGAMLDPMADSLARLLIFASFLALGWISYWVMACFVVRDVGVAYARIYGAQAGLAVGARLSGKVKAVAQGAAIIGIVAVAAFNWPHADVWRLWLGWMAALVTLWSLADYVGHFVMRRKP
ncbi:MAG: CDP-alcohol phosphatidyltransferase family protein [Hyphomonadaceae bacterium]